MICLNVNLCTVEDFSCSNPDQILFFFFRKCTLCWKYCSPVKIQYIAVTQDLCYKNMFAFNQDLKVPTADVLFLEKDKNGTNLIFL